jgi:hypothetical protein
MIGAGYQLGMRWIGSFGDVMAGRSERDMSLRSRYLPCSSPSCTARAAISVLSAGSPLILTVDWQRDSQLIFDFDWTPTPHTS